ncbi:MAG: hypothetical protein JSV91_01715 [Phycisphaerales bacterium]|nr:MAG: hypothetical protein JSV91_01715 [Phycisphaerales bacterium]
MFGMKPRAVRGGKLTAILLVLAGALAVQTPLMAQSGTMHGAIGEAFVPDILQRDATMFVQRLTLDETQRTIFDALLEDYETSFRDRSAVIRQRLAELQPDRGQLEETRRRLQEEAKEELRELLEEMRRQRAELAPGQTDDHIIQMYKSRTEEIRKKLRTARGPAVDSDRLRQILDGYRKVLEEWTEGKRGLRRQFMDNVRLLLNDQQIVQWPAFEREFRREKTLSKGELSGEPLNLFHVIRDMDLEETHRTAVAGPLAEYDVALDAALRPRNDYLPAAQRELAMASETGDISQAETVLRTLTDLRVAVREVNDAFTESIAAVLPPDLRREFRERARARAYPRIYRTTQAQRVFAEARRLADLAPEVLAFIDELEFRYLAELAGANEQLLETVRQHEPEVSVQRALWRIGRSTGDRRRQPDDAIAEGFRRRHELDQRYIQELEGFLTPEQAESLRRLRLAPGAWQTSGQPRSGAGNRAPDDR